MRLAVTVLIICLLSACTAGGAPVVDIYGQSSKPQKVTSGTHRVRQGETLYSIAWRYGWDYRALANANDIPAPYTIYPGQLISLAGHGGDSRPVTRHPSPSRDDSKPAPAKPEPKPSAKPRSTSKPAPAPASSGSGLVSGPITWRWPASGKLVETFSGDAHGQKGIAISGAQGAPVIAAAPGQVVYRGSGLTGYGNLLIIKHNDRWLSAYAHNDKMLVNEGQAVSAGQQIATMGASGTFRTQLHFEIRRDGKPVDPLHYLPKR
ncbi:lipoprotein NlpD [Alcanivorax hongdengensis A-11-3]|uniref:Lipoprotein NlpD n=1 Tax=Alcanivorax hongdengensis A-11-3 TaxID=1177179 RepID=L0WDM2_9GAMM|nr:peptidoglycan DD-metalloendopeptidase family protein [Alcanivorax hongdengensis]EKF75131.1 lipoprotein NlpD [Alcanivorax hongdengensis A-11-3]